MNLTWLPSLPIEDCKVTKDGYEYQGTVSVTEGGHKCKR